MRHIMKFTFQNNIMKFYEISKHKIFVALVRDDGERQSASALNFSKQIKMRFELIFLGKKKELKSHFDVEGLIGTHDIYKNFK